MRDQPDKGEIQAIEFTGVDGVEGEQADIMAAKYVEQEIENQGPENVAAVIGEPISTAA